MRLRKLSSESKQPKSIWANMSATTQASRISSCSQNGVLRNTEERLYGKIDCYLTESLTPDETERLRDAISGRNSDGLGEGFEQREIPIDEGDLYVSYWHSGDDYFLHTEDEFDEYLSQLLGMKFGG